MTIPPFHPTSRKKPARTLTGRTAALVSIVACCVASLALWQVFRPLRQGSQFYLMVFLAGALPLVFLGYRSGVRPRGAVPPRSGAVPRSPGSDVPTPADWGLSALAVVVCLYPVLPVTVGGAGGGYDAFLDRQGLLTPADVIMGTALLVLIIEACRRTTGWVLPAVCLAFLCYGYYGGLLPQSWPVAHAGLDFARSSTRSTTLAAGSTGPRWTSPPRTSCCSPSTGRCWSCREPAGSSSSCR